MSKELLKKIENSSTSELDTLINELDTTRKEEKQPNVLGYDVDVMKQGIDDYNKELEEYLIEKEVRFKFPLQPGTEEFTNAIVPENVKLEFLGDFQPSKTTSLKMLGLNSQETDSYANFMYNLMYGASSNMGPDTVKEYVGNVIQTFNPGEDIQMSYASELEPESPRDINRIQELKDAGFNVDVDDNLLLYKVGDGNWSVVNEPGFSEGDLGYFTKDIASVLLEIPAYAKGGPVGAGLAAGFVESVAQMGAYMTNQKLAGKEVTAEEFRDKFINSLPDAAFAGVSTAVLTKVADKAYKFIMNKLGSPKQKLKDDEIEESTAAVESGSTTINKLDEINKDIQEVTGNTSAKVQLTLGEATGSYDLLAKENSIQKIPELADKYNQAYKQKIILSQNSLEEYTTKILGEEPTPKTQVVSELGENIQTGVSEGLEKNTQKILDNYTQDFSSFSKIYDLINKSSDGGIDLLENTNFITNIFNQQKKLLNTELEAIEGNVSRILGNYSEEITNNLVTLSSFRKTLNLIDNNRSFLRELDPKSAEYSIFKNFLDFTKEGRKTKTLSLEQTQQLIQYVDALSSDSFSAALKNVPDAKKAEFRQLLSALRRDLRRGVNKNLSKNDANELFASYDNLRNLRKDFDNNVINELFIQSKSGKVKLADGHIINHVLSNERFAIEMASILNQTPNLAKKAVFEQAIIDDYIKNVLGDLGIPSSELAKRADKWFASNKYIDNFFTGENRNIIKLMQSPRKFDQYVKTMNKRKESALGRVNKEYEEFTSMDPANYLDYFKKNPTQFNKIISIIRSGDSALANQVRRQTQQFFLREFYDATTSYDARAGMYAFDGAKLLEFLKVNNNREMLLNIFGEQRGAKFIGAFDDIGNILLNFQKKITDIEKEPVITRAGLDIVFGPLNRKRTILRGITRAVKLFGAEDYMDNVLDVETYIKTLLDQEKLGTVTAVSGTQAIEADQEPPKPTSMVDKIVDSVGSLEIFN